MIARWEQPQYETVKEIYRSHLAALAPCSSAGSPPVTSHPGAMLHNAANGAVKEGFTRCPCGSPVEMKYLPSVNRALFDHENISPLFAVLIAFSILLNFTLICFSKSISYFVNFPLIHSKRLCSRKQHNYSHYPIITEPHAE